MARFRRALLAKNVMLIAAAWIDELGGDGSVPPVVTAVASRARTVVGGPARDSRIARARVRAASGRWLVVRASVLADEPGAQVAVMIEPARPHELAPSSPTPTASPSANER